MSFTVDLIGFDTIQERLKTASEKVFTEVDAEIGASAQNMELGAKNDAPKDRGTLVQEISHFQEQPLRWALVSRAFYSAFVELSNLTQNVHNC